MKTITINQLKELLLAQNAAAPVTIYTLTKANCRKTGNPYPDVKKFSYVNGFISFGYETAVRKQEIKEGNFIPVFEAQQRTWGQHKNSCLIEYKNEWYLQIRPMRCRKPSYFVGNKRLKLADIRPFLVKSPQPNQPIENKIIIRTYKLTNIRSIVIGGEKYRIK